MATLSLCMIVKNEERDLAQAIKSVKTIVDEIIVMDTGSTDKTVEIAKGLGAKVHSIEWKDDFSYARNESLKHATSDWILVLDADETISPKDTIIIKGLMEGNDPKEAVGFSFRQRNYLNHSTSDLFKSSTGDSYQESKEFKGWHETRLIRLFANNGKLRYSGKVHESVKKSIIEHNGTIHMTDVPIHHFGKVTSDTKKKGEMYEKLGEEKAKEEGDFKSFFELGIQQMMNGKNQEAIGSLTRAHQIDPENLRAIMNLGTAHIRAGDARMGIEVMKKGVVISEHPDIYNNLGVAYESLGDTQTAFGCYKKSAYIKENVDAYQNIVRVCVNLGKLQDARRVLRRIIELEPDNMSAYHNLGGLYLQDEKINEAIDVLKKALDVKEHPFTYENLASAYSRKGDLSTTKEYLLKAVEAKHPHSDQILKEIERMD